MSSLLFQLVEPIRKMECFIYYYVRDTKKMQFCKSTSKKPASPFCFLLQLFKCLRKPEYVRNFFPQNAKLTRHFNSVVWSLILCCCCKCLFSEFSVAYETFEIHFDSVFLRKFSFFFRFSDASD